MNIYTCLHRYIYTYIQTHICSDTHRQKLKQTETHTPSANGGEIEEPAGGFSTVISA